MQNVVFVKSGVGQLLLTVSKGIQRNQKDEIEVVVLLLYKTIVVLQRATKRGPFFHVLNIACKNDHKFELREMGVAELTRCSKQSSQPYTLHCVWYVAAQQLAEHSIIGGNVLCSDA